MPDFTVMNNEECARIRADLSHAIEANALLIAENRRLRASLASALRYVEVSHAYKGSMTAEQVEQQIINNEDVAELSIGANSCNTLASFNLAEARALTAKHGSQS